MSTVAIVGATGFVGSAVQLALAERGIRVTRVSAPRLSTPLRQATDLLRVAAQAVEPGLVEQLARCDRIVNCAGLARAVGDDSDALFGANSLLPAVLATARNRGNPGARLVHVSSAAVQGSARCLDESRSMAPFSPYSLSKALGEQVLADFGRVVTYRPTSVHGRGRQVTQSLGRLVSSPLASVAGAGDRPTPQVLVENVGAAAAYLASSEEPPPPTVMHPWEGLTTGELVRRLGGREPRHVPESVARAVVGAATRCGRLSGAAAGTARRLEMLWFGQRQGDSWLTRAGWRPPVALERWEELR